MTRFRFRVPPAAFIITGLTLVALVACGGGAIDTPVPQGLPTEPVATTAPSATAAPEPTATPAPTTAVLATPTVAPTPAPATIPAPTATAIPAPPAPTAAPEPSPTPILPTVFNDFGFSLGVQRGADVRATATATAQQGVISFAYGGVNAIMSWTPPDEAGVLRLVSGTYDLLQSNQPDLRFETISDGKIAVDGEPGVFLGFKVIGGSGSAGGGLIGSWTCPLSDTSFTLTLTGTDTVLVQVRFDELLDNFGCSGS